MTRIVMLGLCLAALGAARPARAQAATGTTAGAKAEAGAAAPAAPAARVRASHRVDVIAPGEKIDSVVSRLRAAPAAGGGAATPRGPERGPRPEDRPPGAARGNMPGAGAPGAGAAGPPPAMGGARGGMGPPDRPHR